MARATSSLPTPDSPSIRIGMLEAAAFCASRMTRSMAGLLVMMSLKLTAPPPARARASPRPPAPRPSARWRSPFCSRSGEAGLTTKSNAPLRIAETTVSMPPCAVCTMTGMRDAALAHRLQHADAVEARHDEIEDDRGDVAAAGAVQRLERRLAAVGERSPRSRICVTAASSRRRCTGSSSTMRMERCHAGLSGDCADAGA